MNRTWRPSWPRYLAFARVGMIIVGVAALAGVITAVVSLKVFLSLQPVDGLIVVAGGGALGAQAVRIRRIRITTDESEIRWQGVFQRKRLRRGPDLRGYYGPVSQPRGASVTMLLLTDGQSRLRLVAGLWAESDLDEIATQLQLETALMPCTARQIEDRVPGTTTAIARHPWRTGFVVAGLVFVSAAVVAVVLVLTAGDKTPSRGPARVSAQTVTDQDQLVQALEVALGDSGWPSAQATLDTCGGQDPPPAPGWLRAVKVQNSQPSASRAAFLPKVQTILAKAGWGDFDNEAEGTTQVLNAYRDNQDGIATVEVEVDLSFASIKITGFCEP